MQTLSSCRSLKLYVYGYLNTLAQSEQNEDNSTQGDVEKALRQLQIHKHKVDDLSKYMDETNAKQVCETEPDAKRMRSGREGIVVGYNVQTAV